MSDPLISPAHYRERAEECSKLAEMAGDDQIRSHNMQLAENYQELANSELSVAGRMRRT
jgi:hypothetical protein